ncbi:phosphoribosylanthranilate isomerase [Neoroseomonas oryzicola]|uniref:N-(5'-phosphoribosyl)anthranilate isomerase n=1 Tax=Neoroseomonas oryzicola TaxID=535904 RepID=A0A9X9WEH2_9PROT|nr:phosphoribosylanthranilate isomerase [Neoroseomonas oryzicola]MBR0658732.1 phosphoribosylanthranilate isomerase [Neoroseomonas oryzicola]NKE17832.1 phosphoribosylanthranilate isomerase [Neoroseomonas oryzicola]
MTVEVKICGIRSADAFDAAVEAGADLIGFVFFPPSPRVIRPAEARALSSRHAGGPIRTGLFVDPTDDDIAAVLAEIPLDLIQLQGNETPERAAAIRARFATPVMKAMGIDTEADFAAVPAFAEVVDRFLFDAHPPPGSLLPGGNAQPFEWRLLAGRTIPKPWLLAGGLTAANVAEAISTAQAPGVDVSSGVERSRGVKDAALIRAFIAAAKG